MAKLPTVSFSKNSVPSGGTLIAMISEGAGLPPLLAATPASGQLRRAIKVDKFSGKKGTSLNVAGVDGGLDRIILMGCGKPDALSEPDLLKLGGKVYAAAGKAEKLYVLTEGDNKKGALSPQQTAIVAAGAKLRAYQFDDYLTKGREADKKKTKAMKITMGTSSTAAAQKAWAEHDGVSDGVMLARQLVNEPANVLGPVEFAKQAQKLKSLGVKVQVLTVAEMKKLGMHALLGVSQGSATNRQARMAIMQWEGGKKGAQPLAFIGKGVVFDTGGISIKPAAGMEEMTMDMGGAGVVSGLMKTLAMRKAKANVIGVVGLTENMPDGQATRPGDIVTAMSGTTIEIINTDAEGRLVLADVLHYTQKEFKPRATINLATLTGAMIIALGYDKAGFFSNNDELSSQLQTAADNEEEGLWRLPLGKAYDDQIKSRLADIKNTGGRHAGSITAAQFLKRFVDESPWAHIDIAGVALSKETKPTVPKGASGWGVATLNRLVRDVFEDSAGA